MRRQKAVARNAELLRQVGMYVCNRFHAGHCTAWRRETLYAILRRGPRRATNGCLEGHLPPRMLKANNQQKGAVMAFAEKLIAVRRAHHLTQEQLAAKLFVTRQAVSRWERGEVTPGIDMMKLIACLLYTSPSPRDGLLSRMPSSA